MIRLLSKDKLTDYIMSQLQDTTNSDDLNRFLDDLLIKVEFGHFEPEDEDNNNYVYEQM